MPSDNAQGSEEGFTSAGATAVMAAACREMGLDSEGAKLIRFGENALFRLSAHPVIVRVARSTEYLPSVRNEVQVSRWLDREGFPAARVLEDVQQPLVVEGCPVTFWHLIEEGDRKATYGQLGRILHDPHALTLAEGLELPPFAVFGRTDLRSENVTGISVDDREFLRKRGRELRDRLAELSFESPKGPVHGDAHVQNLMVDRSGKVVLIDFEGFSFDHPERDLMVTATKHHSLGRQTPERYVDFVAACGRDLRDWHRYYRRCAASRRSR